MNAVTNPLRLRMMTHHYPYHVWIVDHPERDIEIFQWCEDHAIWPYDFWEESVRQRCYCFRDNREAVLFKLRWSSL
jgi:hypothetical protein